MRAPASELSRLSPETYRRMPWKNGLGTTTEIAVHPEGASLDAFAWRVSVAEVSASGPFSRFVGYDRVLVQIEGAPMTLVHAGVGERRLERLVPCVFAGELDTSCVLAAPPARDFNVMVRREAASARVTARELAGGGAEGVACGEGEVVLVHVVEGVVDVRFGPARASAGAGETLVGRGAAASSSETMQITSAGARAVALVVEIAGPSRFAVVGMG